MYHIIYKTMQLGYRAHYRKYDLVEDAMKDLKRFSKDLQPKVVKVVKFVCPSNGEVKDVDAP